MRFAIVNKDTKLVRNVICWEGAEFLPPKDHFVVRHDLCDMGDFWEEKTNEFYKIKEDGSLVNKREIIV